MGDERMTQGRKAGAFAPIGGYRYVQRLAEQGGRLFCTFRRVVYRFETSFVDGRWRGSVVRFPAPYDAGEEVWRGDVVAAWRFLHERCGRVFPAWFLGVCAERQPNVILSGYGASLVKGFSEKVRAIVRSDAYRQVFPGVEADRDKAASDEWRLKDSQSTVYAQGLGGAITGKGGNLIVVDDYCKNWEEAESKTMRDKTFESFAADLATRTNSPAHVIVICATRWHEDDVIGRLERRMREDPSYTRWDELVFPARKEGEGGWDTLFPELYDADWYEFQRKNLGPHAAAALLDCDPRTSGARVFREEWLRYWTEPPDERRLKTHVFVDGAKSKADGADFTSILTVGRGADGCHASASGRTRSAWTGRGASAGSATYSRRSTCSSRAARSPARYWASSRRSAAPSGSPST